MNVQVTKDKLIICALMLLSATCIVRPADMTVILKTATQDLLVQEGKTVAISADAQQIAGFGKEQVKYQWTKDGAPIDDGTNATHTLPSVSTNDVATYTVLVSGTGGQAVSAPVHLSVYSLHNSPGNGGTLTAPIGAFTFTSLRVSCSSKTFDRYKAYLPFDGPFRTPPSPTFPNPSNYTKLDISTCNTANGATLDTAVKVQQSQLPSIQVGCVDDDGAVCGYNGVLSTCNSINLQSNKSYCTTIYFINSTLGNNTTVTFTWYYHN